MLALAFAVSTLFLAPIEELFVDPRLAAGEREIAINARRVDRRITVAAKDALQLLDGLFEGERVRGQDVLKAREGLGVNEFGHRALSWKAPW